MSEQNPNFKVSVNTEIGRLRKLLIHSPDSGLGKVVPSKAQDWLFEDIVHLDTIRKGEYDYYIKLLMYFLDPEKIKGKLAQIDSEEGNRNFYKPNHPDFHNSTSVIEIQNLLSEMLENESIRKKLVAAVCAIEGCTYKVQMELTNTDPKELAEIFISGTLANDIMIFAPIPNLIFTRDVGTTINNHILLNKPAKTPFEQAMLRYYPLNVDNLYYHQGIMLAYRQETQKAITWLKKMKPDSAWLPGNPFTGRLVDCHDCDHAAPQKQSFTALSFLQTLNNMQTEIKAGKNVYRNAYQVANAYYNITYYGNARAFYENDAVPAGPTSRYYYDGEEQMEYQLTSMRTAGKYYELARKNAATNEQRARCTFMLSKCALNNIYNDPEFKSGDKFTDITGSQAVMNAYYNYFAELKEKYNKTAYYKEVLRECGYFRVYADKK